MDFAVELRSLQSRLMKLEEAVLPRPSRAGRPGAESIGVQAVDPALYEELRRIEVWVSRLEDRWDRQDHRGALMAARIDRLEARMDQRYTVVELEVHRLRDELPAVIEQTMREVYREERGPQNTTP